MWTFDGGSIVMGLGPMELTIGDTVMGLYGLIEDVPELNGDTLAAALGIDQGVTIHADTPWVKVSMDGKVLLVPIAPIRANISWQRLYELGLVYGDGSIGADPIGEPVLQNKRLNLRGQQYRVRLMRGADTNPTSVNYNTYNPVGTRLSEYSRLMYKLYHTSPDASRWFSFNDVDLGTVVDGKNRLSWFLERHTHFASNAGRVTRGYGGALGFGTSLANNVNTVQNYVPAWRPVLELI